LPHKPETVEPNITYTRAPDVWALGYAYGFSEIYAITADSSDSSATAIKR
jgi:hypothetical protein